MIAIVGAILGLLAFMLAFTFSLAASRFEARRQGVLDEANAIGTTYLRARFLPQPQRDEAARLLREYVDVRGARGPGRQRRRGPRPIGRVALAAMVASYGSRREEPRINHDGTFRPVAQRRNRPARQTRIGRTGAAASRQLSGAGFSHWPSSPWPPSATKLVCRRRAARRPCCYWCWPSPALCS